MQLKAKPQYVDDTGDEFTPLPKYGHLSKKIRQFMEIEPAIDAGMAQFWASPDWPSFRKAAGNADATMPPGGPDRKHDITTELLQFQARDGHMIELKVYKSTEAKQNAALIYRMHGGGWVVGRHEVDGIENVYAAARTNTVVVSVDYRQAPEHPFPQALYDSYDGLVWCRNNAKVLGIDPNSIITAGSSAGGNLAAAVTIMARDAGVPGIVAQILHFPALCHPQFFPKSKYEFGSYVQNYDSCVLSTARMEAFLDAYIPDPRPDQGHSPLLSTTLEGLPPTMIQCAGFDILRDEAFAYAEALRAANTATELYCYQGLPHCFPPMIPDIPETVEFLERYIAFINKYATCS